MQYPPYQMHQTIQPQQMPPGNPKREESFSSQATVFILKDKTWREQSQGTVQFVFDLTTYALRLIIAPGTQDEMDRRLRPRIRSKGPRAYVVRAQAPNNGEDSILAVRFEREEDSQNFRKFVEKRDADNTPSNHPNNPKYSNQQPPMHQQPGPYQQPNYSMNYQNVNPAMMQQYGQPPPKYDNRGGYDNNYNNYYPSPSPQGTYGSQDYRQPTASTMAQPATTPHNGSQHYSMHSQTNPYNGPNGGLVHRPNGSWNPPQNANVAPPYGVEGAPDMYQQQPAGNPNETNDYNKDTNHYTSRSGQARSSARPPPDVVPPQNVNVLKLTEANLEQHNRVYAEISMANKRKNVRDIILEQLQWQREHGISAHG